MRKRLPSPVLLAACAIGAAALTVGAPARADSVSPLGYGDAGLLAFPPLYQAPYQALGTATEKAERPTFSLAVTPTADLPVPVGPETIFGYVDPMAIADSDAIALEPTPNGPLSPAWAFGDRSSAATLADSIDMAIRARTLGAAFAPVAGAHVPKVTVNGRDGAMSWAVSGGSTAVDVDTARQSLSALLAYDLSGGHQISVAAATTRDQALFDNLPNSGADAGWQVGAGANINLANVARFNAGVAYGEGPTADPMGSFGLSGTSATGETVNQWGANAGLSFDVNDTTSVNMGVLYQSALGDVSGLDDPATSAVAAQANVYWQPLNQMRLGWQVMWGEKTYDDGASDRSPEELRTQIGAWFMF